MSIAERLMKVKSHLPKEVKLIAVSKTYSSQIVLQAYYAGQRIFGENKAQEMLLKYQELPKDIEWHLIGHLQSNKVKYIASFVSLIHSVDSIKLLTEINKQAQKNNRIIDCLLQIDIAQEETKFGLSFQECLLLINSVEFKQLNNIKIVGLMGMASNTTDKALIRKEFKSLRLFFDTISFLKILSMGMSSDVEIAIEEKSTMVRLGSSIFGSRF